MGTIFTTESLLIEAKDFSGYTITNIDQVNVEDLDKWMLDIVMNISGHQKNIFIPLAFQGVTSDFLGLRLAMHIRTTKSDFQNANIFIYGTESLYGIRFNEFVSIFATCGVFLIDYNLHTIQKHALTEEVALEKDKLIAELEKMNLRIPTNIYDNHGIANIWGMYRLLELEGIDPSTIKTLSQRKNQLELIYFRWLIAKNQNNNIVDVEVKDARKVYATRLPGLKIQQGIKIYK